MADESDSRNRLAIGLEMLEFYHLSITRHQAETLLLHNGIEGTFLLRRSGAHLGEYTLSVRCRDAVNHYPVTIHVGQCACIRFGQLEFDGSMALAEHLGSAPLIAGEAGTPVVLQHGYPSHVPECAIYDKIILHAETANLGIAPADSADSGGDGSKALHLEVGSKAGYLTKQGNIVKNWKVRWFVLKKNLLSYYKSQDSKSPIKTLDLSQCSSVVADVGAEMPNCLALTFPYRTFYVCGQTAVDTDEWLQVLTFKLKALQGS